VRLFIAANPPEAVLADFSSFVSTLAVGQPRGPGQSVRLVPPDRVHLTLVFLGDVGEDRLPAVKAAMSGAAARWTAGRERREGLPNIRVGGAGRFGRGRFTTVWAGVRGDLATLNDLVTDLRRELRAAKLPFDVKPFRPHVTLARPGERLSDADLAADLEALARYRSPDWQVASIDLMESHQGPNITYERLAAFPL
jgi:RNA 2',3'-cyclic 3'-phosphodiesterase